MVKVMFSVKVRVLGFQSMELGFFFEFLFKI